MKKQLAGILALAMSLSMAACSSDAGSGGAGNGDAGNGGAGSSSAVDGGAENSGAGDGEAASNEANANADDKASAEAEGDSSDNEASQEEAQEPAEDVKYPTAMSMLRDVELENKEVKILTYGSFQVPESAIELFEQKYGGKVTVEGINTDKFYETIDKYIKDGKGIDLVPDYYIFSNWANGKFQPVDSYIDLNSDIWQNTKTAMEAYNFGGKHYELVTDVAPHYYCFYNKETIEENGFDDPWELYKAGNWNWDTFESMLSDFVNQEGEYYGLNDDYYGKALLRSAGAPFAEVSDGHIISNAGNQALKDAVDFGSKLNNNGLLSYDYFYSGDVSYLEKGKQLFYITYSEYVTTYGMPGNLGVVPVPSPAGSDPYQYADVSGYNLCNGAQNPEGAVLFAECMIAANNDPEVKNQKWKGNFSFSDELISQLNEIDSLASRYPVIDFSDNGMDFYSYMNDLIIANAYYYGKAADLSVIDTLASAYDEKLQAALAGME